MARKSFGLCLISILGLIGCYISATGEEKPTSNCSITITDPKDDNPVGLNGLVRGTAQIPPPSHLWVLAHKKGFNGWWPQGGGETPIENGKWEVSVTYGIDSDTGDFQVAAVAVDDAANSNLNRWVATAPERKYPPTTFPGATEGCKPAQVTVKR